MKFSFLIMLMILLVEVLNGQKVDTISLRGTYFSTSSKHENYIQNRKVITYSLGRYVWRGNSYDLETIIVPENVYQAYQDSTNSYFVSLGKCKPCWQKNYTFEGRLISEGMGFTDCMVGDYFFYYSNGEIYISSSYKKNDSNDWSNLHNRKLCGQNGVELFYSTNGKLIKTNFYVDGKLINCIDEE